MIGWVPCILVLLTGQPAALEAKSEQARRFYQAGGRAFDAGQYPVAITAFEEANRLAPRAVISFALAQAYRLQFFIDADPSKLKRAVELYRTYLIQEPTGGRREHAVEHIATLEPMLQRLEAKGPVRSLGVREEKTQLMISAEAEGVECRLDGGDRVACPAMFDVAAGKHSVLVEAKGYFPETVETMAVEGKLVAVHVDLTERPGLVTVNAEEGAELAVDGRGYGELPLQRPLELAEGAHLIAVTAGGAYPFVREVQVAKGETLTLEAVLETTAQRKVAYGFLVGSGAIIASALVTGGLAFKQQSLAQDYEARLKRGESLTEAEADSYATYGHRRDGLAIATFALVGTAAVATIVGLILYFADHPQPE